MSKKKKITKAAPLAPTVKYAPSVLSPEEIAKNKTKIDDANLQFVVLMQLIIEKTEFLEANGYIYGTVKNFLVNGKKKYEEFIRTVFSCQEEIEGDSSLAATNKLNVLQERVEIALLNQYVLTVDERRNRAKEILSQYLIAPMVDKALDEMETKNLFNF